jgi:sterol desaturase/sphingolipid hydroxylase (fatty acid hydroxylase superfamily)
MEANTPRTDTLKASPRMFDSDLLDKLSRVHPAVPVIIFVPAIAILVAVGLDRVEALAVIGLFLAGYLFWTLAEYWLHRVVFHFEPDEGIGKRLHWIIHGVHHDHPNDPMRLVMPPSVSIPLATLFLLLFWTVLGPEMAPAFGGGYLAGYLVYDMTHFYLHHGAPTTKVGKLLRTNHMRHHFQDHERGYGVSVTIWDHVFRTRSRARAASRTTS